MSETSWAEERRETANNFLNKSQNNNNKRNSQPITPLGQVYDKNLYLEIRFSGYYLYEERRKEKKKILWNKETLNIWISPYIWFSLAKYNLEEIFLRSFFESADMNSVF